MRTFQQLHLIIEPLGNVKRRTTVCVGSNLLVGTFVSTLIRRFDLPITNHKGTPVTYCLYSFIGKAPLPGDQTFADLKIRSGSHFLLTSAESTYATLPLEAASAASIISPALQVRSRRNTLVFLGTLGTFAFSGLGSGIAAAQYVHRRVSTTVSSSSAVSSPTMLAMPQAQLRFTQHQQTVRTVVWSLDGMQLASGGDDALLLLWRTDGTVQQQIPHQAPVMTATWSPDGMRIVSAAAKSVIFFATDTGTILAHRQHANTVMSVAWNANNQERVVSGSLDMRAIVWQTMTYQPQTIFTHHTTAIEHVAWASDGQTIASASRGGVVRIWNADSGMETHSFYQEGTVPMHTLSFSRDQHLAVGSDDGIVRIWSNGMLCQQITGMQCIDTPLRIQAHASALRTAHWSPDGHLLATGGDDGIVALWDGKGSVPLLTIPQSAPVLALSWSPDGQRLAVAAGQDVIIWAFQQKI